MNLYIYSFLIFIVFYKRVRKRERERERESKRVRVCEERKCFSPFQEKTKEKTTTLPEKAKCGKRDVRG
jgi:hypothetical protein